MFSKSKQIHPDDYDDVFDIEDQNLKPEFVTHQYPPLKNDSHIIIDIKKNIKNQGTQTYNMYPPWKSEFLEAMTEFEMGKHQRHRDNLGMAEIKDIRAEVKSKGRAKLGRNIKKFLGTPAGTVVGYGASALIGAGALKLAELI